MPAVPLNEITVEFSRSSGPGGQNVNKTATKVLARWSVGKSGVFSEEEKNWIRSVLGNRLTNNDEIMVVSEEERSQSRNRERAVARLQELVRKALVIKKKRRATRPTWSSKIRRLESKSKKSRIKKSRRGEI